MDLNTGLPRLFLRIKLTSLISISSVTEESVFLRRLYSTEVFNSVCVKSQKSWVRDKCVRPTISGVWLHFRGMSWSAKSSICWQPFRFLLCIGKNSSRDSQGTEIRHVFRQFCASFAGIELASNQPAQALFCFPAFLPYWFKNISGLWSQIKAPIISSDGPF